MVSLYLNHDVRLAAKLEFGIYCDEIENKLYGKKDRKEKKVVKLDSCE